MTFLGLHKLAQTSSYPQTGAILFYIESKGKDLQTFTGKIPMKPGQEFSFQS